MLRKLATLLLAPAVLLGVLGVTGATAADDAAAGFVARANAERAAAGLRPLAVKRDLAAVAGRPSTRMAQKNSLYHNPNLEYEVSGWQVVGENVGMGGTVDSIHKAFMDSPEHRANILARDYTQIGVGTVTDADGVLWVTQVFRLPVTAAAPAPTRPRVVVSPPRATVNVPVRPTPARPAAVKPARVVARPVPAAPAPVDATALAGALADTPGTNAFGLALTYADTMAALGR